MSPSGPLLRILCAAALPALGGCWFWTTEGDPHPPASFGPLATHTGQDCPSMQGVYLWPPVRAEHPGRFKGMDLVATWDGDLPTRVSRTPGQIWVSNRPGELLVRSRPAGIRMADDTVRYWEPGRFPGPDAGRWYTARYTHAECHGHMLALTPEPQAVEGVSASGAPVERTAHLARLADGSLAVGIRARSSHRTVTITGWEYSVMAKLPAPDEVTWTWWMLRPAGDGAQEPGPVGPEHFDPRGRVR